MDMGVGPSTSDVSCHNLDVVHNTWRVQLHIMLSHTASESLWFRAAVLPQELNRNQICRDSRINDHRARQQVKYLAIVKRVYLSSIVHHCFQRHTFP